jgi:hypothetical protein
MKTKHTPGSWAYECKPGRTDGFVFSDNETEGLNVCTINPDTRVKHDDRRKSDDFIFSDQRVADARLIAAAPDLLYALNLMLREHDALQIAENRTDDRWPAATAARAAIQKAIDE